MADACAGDWDLVRPHLVVDMLRTQADELGRLQAENQQLSAERSTRMQQNDRMAERIAQLEARYVHASDAPKSGGIPPDWKLVPVGLSEEMKCTAMELLLDGLDIYVNGQDQIVIETDAPRRLWKAMLAAAPVAPVRQPLTDDQCIALLKFGQSSVGMVRAIERAHGITAGGSNAD